MLDDGFSHLALARDIDLLVFPRHDPLAGGRLPPGGRLREPLESARWADALLWSGRNAEEADELASGLAVDDPLIRESIGTVQSVGWLPRGKLELDGSDGSCELSVPIEGERDRAQLEARLVRRGGVWFWEWANLRTTDGQLLTLSVP